jgi:hypothetical protein
MKIHYFATLTHFYKQMHFEIGGMTWENSDLSKVCAHYVYIKTLINDLVALIQRGQLRVKSNNNNIFYPTNNNNNSNNNHIN